MALGDFHFSSLRMCTYCLYSYSAVTWVGFCFGGWNVRLKDKVWKVQFGFSLFSACSLVTLLRCGAFMFLGSSRGAVL